MRTLYKRALKFKNLFHSSKATIFMALGKDVHGGTESRNFFGTLKSQWSAIDNLNRNGFDIFMLINQAKGDRRKADNITKVNAFFIDYDRGDWSADNVDEFLARFPVRPQMVVQTSPGNFHVYWSIEHVPLDQFKAVQQKLAAKYGSDEKVCDLPRVMRMPGTYNHKHSPPFLVRLIYVDDKYQTVSYQKFVLTMCGDEVRGEGDDAILERAVVSKAGASDDVEAVHRALECIPADDRKLWVTVGLALKNRFGDEGLAVFKDWSSKSAKYEVNELERQWRSFGPDGGVTIRTLFWVAKLHSANDDVSDRRLTEITNLLDLAKHFALTSINLLRHSEDTNKWFAFIYGRWERSDKEAVRTATSYLQKMKLVAARSKVEQFQKVINGQQSPTGVRELLRAAESDRDLSVKVDAFDQAPNILGVRSLSTPSGIACHQTIRLDVEKCRYSKPEDMLLRIAGPEYDPAAQCPLWLEFLDEVTVGDKELAEYLQRAVGYTLYGHTNEQVMFVLIGSGGNGKGVFSRAIYSLFGDYAAVLQSNLLKPGAINANNPSPALMMLKSKRLWTCSEIPKGMVLDEGLTKQLTGGDIVSSRHLYGDQNEFLPVGKLWLSVNDMPRIRHDDKGMWRRIVPIPFNAVFSGKNCDRGLDEKLKLELSGILNWAIEGARKYAAMGRLGRPKASRDLLSQLRVDTDTIGLWIKSRCVVTANGRLQSQRAYDDYCAAMKRERVSPLPQKEFKADLERRGYFHKQGRKFNFFLGLDLSDSA